MLGRVHPCKFTRSIILQATPHGSAKHKSRYICNFIPTEPMGPVSPTV